MKFFSALTVALVLTAPTLAAPKYVETTTRLSKDHAYLQQASNTDYWSIAPYYLPQHNAKACSVASTAMVMNALRASDTLSASDELFTSDSVIKKNKAYAKAVGPVGKGQDLDSLGKNFQELLDQTFKGRFKTTIMRFDGADAAAEKNRLVEVLTQNEKNPSDFIVANFLQGILTGDAEGMIGHISPVGAFDAKNGKVLIMDSDRQYYEPYWVSIDKFMEALNSKDDGVKKARGLLLVSPKN